MQGGEQAPAGLDLLLLLPEATVDAARARAEAFHGPVGRLPHQLPLPLLLRHEGGVGDGGEGVGDGDEAEEVVGGEGVAELPVADGGEVLGAAGGGGGDARVLGGGWLETGSRTGGYLGAPGRQHQGHAAAPGHQPEGDRQLGPQQTQLGGRHLRRWGW